MDFFVIHPSGDLFALKRLEFLDLGLLTLNVAIIFQCYFDLLHDLGCKTSGGLR